MAEDNCAYFDFADTPRTHSVSAQITQIKLEDFGMSYVIRLTDGRFIVIDGGRPEDMPLLKEIIGKRHIALIKFDTATLLRNASKYALKFALRNHIKRLQIVFS